jgi:hypothetical protein
MRIERTTYPNDSEVRVVTLGQIMALMPDAIPFPLTVWVGDRLGKFGRTSEPNVIFYVLTDEFPSNEMKQYFNDIVSPLGITATCSHYWNSHLERVSIYNKGVLIRDRQTLELTGAPVDIELPPVITASYVRSRLPEAIPFTEDIYLTGSLMHPEKGWSGKDMDIIVFGLADVARKIEIKRYFEELTKWRCDVGHEVMANRGDVYTLLAYSNGTICLP